MTQPTFKDRVRETSVSTGTGDFTLDGPETGYVGFYASLGTGVETCYVIEHQVEDEWEIGLGQLSDATTLVRSSVLRSSNADAAVDFSAGDKNVFLDVPAAYLAGRIQDQRDFDASWSPGDSTGYLLVYNDGTQLWTPSQSVKDLIVGAGSIGTDGVGVLVLSNATTPTTRPADEVQLYAADYAAGDSRLQIWSETGTAIWIGNGKIEAKAPAGGAGNPLTLKASDAADGNTNGGDTIVQLANSSGSGSLGKFLVRDNAATNLFTCDSSVASFNFGNSSSSTLLFRVGSGRPLLQRSGQQGLVFDTNTQDILPAYGNTIPSAGAYMYFGTTTYPFGGAAFKGGYKASPCVQIDCGSTTTVGLKIQFASGTPTADAFQVTQNDGTVLSRLDARGGFGFGIAANTVNAYLCIASQNAGVIPGVFRGFSSQTANLIEAQNVVGTPVFSVTAQGAVNSSIYVIAGGGGNSFQLQSIAGGMRLYDNTAIAERITVTNAGLVGINDSSVSGSQLSVACSSASTVGLTVTGDASQTANLLTLKKGSSTVAYVNSSGYLAQPGGYFAATTGREGIGNGLMLYIGTHGGCEVGSGYSWYTWGRAYFGPNYNSERFGIHINNTTNATPAVCLFRGTANVSQTGDLIKFVKSDDSTAIYRVQANGGVIVSCQTTSTVGHKITLASGSPTADAFQVTDSVGNAKAVINSAGSFSNTGGQTGSEIFGSGANVSGASAVAIGNGASAGLQGVAIGYGCSNAGSGVTIGYGASGGANSCTVVGYNTYPGANSRGIVLLGYTNRTNVSNRLNSIAIGDNITLSADNQCCIGGSSPTSLGTGGITELVIGNGPTNSSPASVLFHTSDASGTDISGGTLTIAPGKGTGSAPSGNINFQVSLPGSSGSTLGTLVTPVVVSPSTSHVTITSQADAIVPLTVAGTASQTANIIEFKKGSTTVGYFLKGGGLYVNQPSGDGSNLLSLNLNSFSRFNVDSGGNLTMNGRVAAQNAGAGYSIFTYLQAGDHLTTFSSSPPLIVNSSDSSTGPMIRIARSSTTSTGRPQCEIYTDWIVNTDATRTSRVRFGTYYTSTLQEGLRIDSSSTQARLAIGGNTSATVRLVLYSGQTTDVGFQIQLASGQTADAFQVTDSVGNTKAVINSNGDFSRPNGTNSEQFGKSAVASNTNTVAIGYTSTASGLYATAIGAQAQATAQQTTAIGRASTASGAGALAIGDSANVTATNAVAIGNSTTITGGSYGIAIGSNANSSGNSTIAIGSNADGRGGVAVGVGAVANSQNATALGGGAYANAQSVAVGQSANADATNSIAIGYNSTCAGYNGIAFGYGATLTANYQMVIRGSSYINDVYIGNGVTATVPTNVTINVAGGNGTDVTGGNLTLAAGKGTGSATSGTVKIQVSLAGASGSSLRSLTDIVTFSPVTQHVLVSNKADVIGQKIQSYVSQTVDPFQVTKSDGTVLNKITAAGAGAIYLSSSSAIGQTIRLASSPTVDALEVQDSSSNILTSITKEGHVKSANAAATQYVALKSNSGTTGDYPGLEFKHDGSSYYLTLGYGILQWYTGGTDYFGWSHTYGFLNKTPYTRVGTDSNVTPHEIYRTTSYANTAKGGGIKIYGDNGPTGATNSDGGDILLYGGTGRGTGVAGDIRLGYNGSAAVGTVYAYNLQAYNVVEANTADSASPNLLAATESRKVLTNEGATAENYHTLPAAAAGLDFEFICQDADGIRITAAAGDTIRDVSTVSATAGYIRSSTVGSVVRLKAVNATEWFVVYKQGTWTIDA